jgi:ABC-type glycerol-3-phosphate transport system permease component
MDFHILKRAGFYPGLLFLVLFILLPYVWMTLNSFKNEKDMYTADVRIPALSPEWIPKNFTLQNYITINNPVPIIKCLIDSFIISIFTSIICTLISFFTAYALSRMEFSLKKVFNKMLFIFQILPVIAILVSYYLVINKFTVFSGIRIRGTFYGLILTYTALALPFSIFILKYYLASIPKEIEEHAKIEGCGIMQLIFKIILPASLPGILTAYFYSFIFSWNDMLVALLFSGGKIRNLSIGLMDYITLSSSYWVKLMTSCTIFILPVLILFILLRKHIINHYIDTFIKLYR